MPLGFGGGDEVSFLYYVFLLYINRCLLRAAIGLMMRRLQPFFLLPAEQVDVNRVGEPVHPASDVIFQLEYLVLNLHTRLR